MRLPRLPNSFVKARSQTVQFLGINLTENFQDGEMNDCKNLSTLQYPTLTQRKGREAMGGYDNMVSDIFEWDGKLIVVSNGTLYVDGDPIASVSGERKQFAVINSRLVVFPDKISIDLRNNEFIQLDVSATTPGTSGSVTITHNSITAPIESKLASGRGTGFRGTIYEWGPIFYTYGTDMTAVRECWNEETMTWDMTALESLKKIHGIYSYPCRYVSGAINGVSIGEIFIPEVVGLSSYNLVDGQVKNGVVTYPDTSRYNNLGYVGVVTGLGDDNYDSTSGIKFDWTRDIYDLSGGNSEFSELFNVGDMIDITGTRYGLLDTKYEDDDTTTSAKLKITGITETTATQTNALQFADNTFKVPYAAMKLTAARGSGTYYFFVNQPGSTSYYYYKFTTDRRTKAGSVLVIYGTEETQVINVWDTEKHKVIATYSGTRSTNTPSGATNLGRMALYDTSSAVITIQRAIPDLDFICERDNRLWGVSNNDKTIYASALGLPWVFYDYTGLDTDSYAVAVGSAGDFTGIVDYGGVLCFKENCVHKMLGSFPSDFYMTTYNVAGIMSGAERSAVIISEILYYRSNLGVMAFTGYQPTNISPNLALENTKGGVGGTNGQEYYLCVQAKDESHHSLFKYDLQRKLWTKEEDIDVTGMANIGNDLYLTIHTQETIEVDGTTRVIHHYTPYATGQENEEGMNLEWFAQFKPYTETEGGIRKAGYTRLVLRFDMAPGSVFKIKVRYDNGLWEDAWTQPATPKLSHTVPLRIKRCDKFELRLEGKGQTKIRSIVREFVQGGWFDNGSSFYR